MVRGILHSVQLCQQISASISNNTELYLIGPSPPSSEPPFGGSLYSRSRFGGSLLDETFGRPLLELPGIQDSIDHIDWVEFLRIFTGVNSLQLRGELHDNIVHALELVTRDMVAKVLPALHTLQFFEEPPTVSVNRFVTVRQNAGRPVNIIYPDDDHNEEEDDSDE